jgi:5-methylcytosine-specific restriction endonuclease McrA
MRLRQWKYSRLKYEAKRRKLEFSLTREEYAQLRNGASCHYCGGPLPDYGYALDRKDSSQGYTRDNVVPCCRICNHAKGDELSYTEMLELGRAVARIRLRRLEPRVAQ